MELTSHVHLLEAEDGAKDRAFPVALPPRQEGDRIVRSCVTRNARFLALLYYSGLACRVDLRTGEALVLEHTFPQDANGMALSESGQFWVAADWKILVVWDTHTQQKRSLPNARHWARGLDFSPDGTLLASAGVSARIEILRVPEFSLITVLRGHQGEATFAQFSPEGRTLVSSEVGEGLRFWSVDQWRELLHIKVPDLFQFRIAPDGQSIAVEIKPQVDYRKNTRIEIIAMPRGAP
jgi:WD40 repeat protein